MRDRPLTVTVRAAGDGRTVVHAEGNADHDTVGEIEAALEEVTEPAALTVVDMSRVDFADSSVLHVLLDTQRRYRNSGGRLVIAGPLSVVVERLFGVTGTRGFFSFADSVEKALGPGDEYRVPDP